MDVFAAIEERRAYRALEPVEITDKMVDDLAHCASLAPSCFNNQPWRFVFVRNKTQLERMRAVMNKGNEWAFKASMIIAVFAKLEDDCRIKDREYYLFDTGLATAQLILRATEMGLVAHPIAGYDQDRAKQTLNIPADRKLITLIIVGKHSKDITGLTAQQVESENARPQRDKLSDFAFRDEFR